MKEHLHSPNELRRCVESAVRARGIHLYNSTGVPPSAKIFGKLEPLSDEIMKPGEIDLIAQDIKEDVHKEKFSEVLEMNLAISLWGVVGRSGPLTLRKTG